MIKFILLFLRALIKLRIKPFFQSGGGEILNKVVKYILKKHYFKNLFLVFIVSFFLIKKSLELRARIRWQMSEWPFDNFYEYLNFFIFQIFSFSYESTYYYIIYVIFFIVYVFISVAFV